MCTDVNTINSNTKKIRDMVKLMDQKIACREFKSLFQILHVSFKTCDLNGE